MGRFFIVVIRLPSFKNAGFFYGGLTDPFHHTLLMLTLSET